MYWPDETAVSQMTTDLVRYLDSKEYSMTVMTSKYDYNEVQKKYISSNDGNIRVIRVGSTSLGKRNKLARIIDIVTFNVIVFLRLLSTKSKEYDCIIGLTNPPLLSFFGVIGGRIKHIPFVYWVMDIQPELSFRLGYLKRNSIFGRIVSWVSNKIFKYANEIVVLDHYMENHVKGNYQVDNLTIIPVWQAAEVLSLTREENTFIQEYGLKDKYVVMYSGNLSIAHPIDTILQSAIRLKDEEDIVFMFVGDGVRMQEVKKQKELNQLQNVIILSFQPRTYISTSLAAADMQVVTMGNETVGCCHPCKIYTVMAFAKPVLYVGPPQSHVVDLIQNNPLNLIVKHDEVEKATKSILSMKRKNRVLNLKNADIIQKNFSKSIALEKWAKLIDGIC